MAERIAFWDRLKTAWQILISGEFAAEVDEALHELSAARTKTPPPPEKTHASGLMLLAAFQREGRLIDFLQQDVAAFSDEEVGGAARVVHSGCRKALERLIAIAPVLKDAEDSHVIVPAGFDSSRIRLTGNVAGQPPYKGSLKHHGWVATQVKFPTLSDAIDYCVVAPAEVEL